MWAGCSSDPAEPRTQSKSSTSVVSAAHQQTAAGCARRKVIYYSKVLRAASYSEASRSARSGACDPTVFPPEKISPDSLAAGREHAGWDVCFLRLLFVSALDDFSSTSLSSPSSSLFVYDDDSLPFDLLPPIYIPVRPSDFFSSVWFFPSSSLPSAWCQCSVSCGGGVQARTVQCLRQGRPAAGCLPYQRPVTSRACNTQFCPPAAPAPAQSPGRVATAGGSTLKGKIHLRDTRPL